MHTPLRPRPSPWEHAQGVGRPARPPLPSLLLANVSARVSENDVSALWNPDLSPFPPCPNSRPASQPITSHVLDSLPALMEETEIVARPYDKAFATVRENGERRDGEREGRESAARAAALSEEAEAMPVGRGRGGACLVTGARV